MFEIDAENWTAGPGFFPNGVVGVSLILRHFFNIHFINQLTLETKGIETSLTLTLILVYLIDIMRELRDYVS
jgi:hypothetical protein